MLRRRSRVEFDVIDLIKSNVSQVALRQSGKYDCRFSITSSTIRSRVAVIVQPDEPLRESDSHRITEAAYDTASERITIGD